MLDYALGVARDPACRSRMYVVPVGINYDRVLEDRTLLRELETRAERPVASRGTQIREVGSYLFSNVRRLVTGRWKRYGRAAVAIGTPVSIDAWLTQLEKQEVNVLAMPRAERLPFVQQFCDNVLQRIGNIIPVTSVPLACAAIQSFDSEFIPREKLLARMEAMRDVLLELNSRVIQPIATSKKRLTALIGCCGCARLSRGPEMDSSSCPVAARSSRITPTASCTCSALSQPVFACATRYHSRNGTGPIPRVTVTAGRGAAESIPERNAGNRPASLLRLLRQSRPTAIQTGYHRFRRCRPVVRARPARG